MDRHFDLLDTQKSLKNLSNRMYLKLLFLGISYAATTGRAPNKLKTQATQFIYTIKND